VDRNNDQNIVKGNGGLNFMI